MAATHVQLAVLVLMVAAAIENVSGLGNMAGGRTGDSWISKAIKPSIQRLASLAFGCPGLDAGDANITCSNLPLEKRYGEGIDCTSIVPVRTQAFFVSCPPGFALVEDYQIISCKFPGRWDNDVFTCDVAPTVVTKPTTTKPTNKTSPTTKRTTKINNSTTKPNNMTTLASKTNTTTVTAGNKSTVGSVTTLAGAAATTLAGTAATTLAGAATTTLAGAATTTTMAAATTTMAAAATTLAGAAATTLAGAPTTAAGAATTVASAVTTMVTNAATTVATTAPTAATTTLDTTTIAATTTMPVVTTIAVTAATAAPTTIGGMPIFATMTGSITLAPMTTITPVSVTDTTTATTTTTTAPYASPLGTSIYRKYTDSLSWDDAQTKCIGDGANLAIIGSVEEFNHLANLASNSTFYVGMNAKVTSKVFVPVDGSALVVIPAWSSGQPDDLRGNERCAQVWFPKSGAGLNDCSCSNAGSVVICEKPA